MRGPSSSTIPTLVRNLPILEQAAAGRGIFTQVEEHDGIVRRAPVIMNAGNAFVPSLSLEMLRVGDKFQFATHSF